MFQSCAVFAVNVAHNTSLCMLEMSVSAKETKNERMRQEGEEERIAK